MSKEELTHKNFGSAYFYNNDILITKSSGQFLFFKIYEIYEKDKFGQSVNVGTKWNQYHSIDIQGTASLLNGSNQLQICSSNLVYFYEIEPETYIPKHVGTMFNFINCSYFFIGLLDQRCLTYKNNDKNIRVFMRKHVHGFHHQIDRNPKENVCGVNMNNLKSFLVSDDDFVSVHCADTFTEIHKFNIPLNKSNTNLPIEIIELQISSDHNYIAVVGGKILAKEIEEIHQLMVFKVNSNRDFELVSKFHPRHKLPSEFKNYSKQITFCNNE